MLQPMVALSEQPSRCRGVRRVCVRAGSAHTENGSMKRANWLTYAACAAVMCSTGAAMARLQPPSAVLPSKDDKPGEVPNIPVHGKERTGTVQGEIALIPRALLFGNPDKTQARVSPDGSSIAYLAPVNGVLNVFVGPAGDLSKAKPVTNDDRRGIRRYFWAHNGKNIVFLQDKGGDENWRVYSADVATGAIKDLTPMEGVAAQIVNVSEKFPDEILVGLNDRDAQWHDLYRLNLRTGEKTLVVKNEGYAEFVTDDDFRVRFALQPDKSGGLAVLRAVEDGKSGFEPFEIIPMEDTDTTSFVGFDKSGTKAYMIDSRGRNTAALFEVDIATKQKKRMLEDDRTDISGVMINPITKKIEAAQTNYEREIWSLFDMNLNADFMAMRAAGGMGDMNVTSRSDDDRFWTISFLEDDGPVKTYLLNRGDLKDPKRKPVATLLFVSKPALAEQPLAPMHPVTIKARDGVEMVSYLTLPLDADRDRDGKPEKAVPMVLLVHGGPWARDSWGFDPEAQWLANRGYAVLQVNFRGSTGFGKDLINKSNLQWAGTMHDDLVDAVKWAVDQKIADPKKIAIMGGSYGGYATLVGLTFTPELFACGVDIVGPSNLNTLLSTIPPYWLPAIEQMTRRIGDMRTPEGKKFLDERSPLSRVDQIKRPLLIGQGANDPRVKQAEADQIVKAMQSKNIPVTYVLYPDEGHGFARPENRLSFFAVAEAFLGQHLGGRVEPIGGALKGSTIKIPAGGDQVPGLSEAMSAAASAESK